MTSPNDFLAATVGASASMVAIVAGLMVSRFIAIDSSIQSAKNLVEGLEEELVGAEDHLKRLREQRLSQKLKTFLSSSDVLGEMIGATECPSLMRLRSLASPANLSDEELEGPVTEVYEEVGRAHTVLASALAQHGAASTTTWQAMPAWTAFNQQYRSYLGVKYSWVWEFVYEELIRNQERKTQVANRSSVTRTPYLLETDAGAARTSNDEQSTELRAAVLLRDQLEDKYFAAVRSYNAADRPDKLLKAGLGILVYFTVVGVIVPLHTLSTEPDDFTPGITSIFRWFLSGLFFLFGYMIIIAFRLLPGHSKLRLRAWGPTTLTHEEEQRESHGFSQ